ncbi:uncharacterized protein PADG_11668 [Paracoccidioides brasiliensis Pb18]|uniref:Uncharacterized protein n=1 Tax=Paracoccidioides brasiliensis (strain Pb18) TaxID=502780 RepID=A0A0A0HU29_PARBD|nr:uncharacterized protein PADG_11668 [Paracoccidioides brasiliensis Pb18]KGM92132.1 hypothetical protein PADG_11668 [Paracoccidioides brasiliensis Pb18]
MDIGKVIFNNPSPHFVACWVEPTKHQPNHLQRDLDPRSYEAMRQQSDESALSERSGNGCQSRLIPPQPQPRAIGGLLQPVIADLPVVFRLEIPESRVPSACKSSRLIEEMNKHHFSSF